jgi:hypothetical protein
MSRVSDTRLRTREAAAHLVAAGRRPQAAELQSMTNSNSGKMSKPKLKP